MTRIPNLYTRYPNINFNDLLFVTLSNPEILVVNCKLSLSLVLSKIILNILKYKFTSFEETQSYCNLLHKKTFKTVKHKKMCLNLFSKRSNLNQEI